MKKIVLVYAIAAFIACSCTGMQEAPEISGVPMVLTAYQEGTPDTKTAVEDGGKQVFWEPGDEIKVFSGSRSGKFTSSAESLEAVTTFTGHLEGTGPDIADIWAVYPYSDEATFDGETITAVIPSVQTARPGTFAKGANVAIAHSTTTNLQFYNVGGGIRFSLAEEGVTSVFLESLNDEYISGTISIGFSGDYPTVSKVSDGSPFISLVPQGGGTFAPGVWYYFVVVPGTLENGFRLVFYESDATGSLEYNKSLTIKRKTFASISNADARVSFISNETVDGTIQELAEQIAPCVTSEMTAPEQINAIVAEIESIPAVKSVEVGESSTSVLLDNGETLIYPYDYPSAFDDIDDKDVAPQQKRFANTRSGGLDTGYFDADVVIFNLFSNQSGRKNQNKLMENVKYTLENGLYKKSVCYLGLDDFTVENVKKAINHRSIIFFSTLGSTDSKYICTGEEYLVGKPLDDLQAAKNTHFVTTVKYEDKYKGEKRYALNVKDLMKRYSGPLMYFASCNSLKGDFSDVNARVVGWDGINKCGQAFALIIADYLAGGRAMGAFLKDFTENHSQVGDIVDPLKPETKLKYLNGGWDGYQYNGFYENLLKQPMTIVSPVPGSCVKTKSKYTVNLVYNNPDPSNIITDGKHCVYENENRYFLGFDNMNGDSPRTSQYLYVDKNSEVNYTDKNFGAGVWKIVLYQQGAKDNKGYSLGHSYLIMHKGYEKNDIEIEEDMPDPVVRTLSASVEDQGVLATGVVINRTLEGLQTGFQLYQFTSDDLNRVPSQGDSLLLVNQGTMIASSVEYKGYYGVMLKDLAQGGKYLIRAFATDESNNTSFGDIISFQFGEEVTPPSGEYPSPEAVDLGLSVKWASFNLGASKPEEYGDYFAWGETEQKEDYSLDSYLWINVDPFNNWTWLKYTSDESQDTIDYKTALELEDDAARVKLGGNWRMPTMKELMELHNECKREWTTQNGVVGYLLTSRTDGLNTSVFLPACGYRHESSLSSLGTKGYYWSSSLEKDNQYASMLLFDEYTSGRSFHFRKTGLPIRPVLDETPSIFVQGVHLLKTDTQLYVNDTAQLICIIEPTNATDKSVSWYSDNTSVADVSSAGLIIAKQAGTANVYVKTSDGGFTASCKVDVTELGPQAVDLGLGVKWASCNLGALKPTESGRRYAWGETGTKEVFDWSSYIFFDYTDDLDNIVFSKYRLEETMIYDSETGDIVFMKPDGLDTLLPSDDAATTELGGAWRIPTKKEWEELIDFSNNNCSRSLSIIDGIGGIVITSNKEGYKGNSIFIPYSSYWSSSLHNFNDSAWCMSIQSVATYGMIYQERYLGAFVRPVTD